MLERMRRADQTRWFGETLLDQSVVAGIGNMWLAEALWEAELSPWRRLGAVSDDDRRRSLEQAAELMRDAVDSAWIHRGGWWGHLKPSRLRRASAIESWDAVEPA